MNDRRPLIVLLIVVVAMVGGAAAFKMNKSSASDEKPLSTANPSVNPTTTSVASGPLDTQWQTALAAVTAGENALFQNPDPDKVDRIMLPTCSCYSDTVTRLTNLKNKSQHIGGDDFRLVNPTFVSADESKEQVSVVAIPISNESPTVDSKGSIVEPGPKGAGHALAYVLQKGDDGAWRIADRRDIESQS